MLLITAPIAGTLDVMHGRYWLCSEATLVESPSPKFGADEIFKLKSDDVLLAAGEAEATVNVKALIKKFDGRPKDSAPLALKCGHGFRSAVLRAAAAIDAGKPWVPAVACAAEEDAIAVEKSNEALISAVVPINSEEIQIHSLKFSEKVEDMDAVGAFEELYLHIQKSSKSSESKTLDGISDIEICERLPGDMVASDEKADASPLADEPSLLIPVTEHDSTGENKVLATEPVPVAAFPSRNLTSFQASTKIHCLVYSPDGTTRTEWFEPSDLALLRKPADTPAIPSPLAALQPQTTPAPATIEEAPSRRNPFRSLKAKLQGFARKCVALMTRSA
ncbi:hypothetical protein HDU96_010516 [Phlyctochytrium bullatum]|nr:hypothetical protein HDU96_010516 [Phlyctochytrium bullatum]